MKILRCSALKIKTINNSLKNIIIDLAWWTLGSILFSIAINVFTAPNDITVGGFSGIATVLNYLFDIPIGFCVFLLNVPLFLISFSKLGYKFLINTVIATFETSFFIDLFAPFLKAYSGDKLLSAIFGGVLLGAGLGLIFWHGATTGGTDILAKLLRLKFAHLSMGRVMLMIDLIIVLLSFLAYRSIEAILYALVTIFVSTQAIDLVSSGFSHSKTVLIVTEHGEEIANEILYSLDRGVTILNAYGGYTKNEKQILFCAVRANDVPQFSKLVTKKDKNSFMVVTDADDIVGEGFGNKYK